MEKLVIWCEYDDSVEFYSKYSIPVEYSSKEDLRKQLISDAVKARDYGEYEDTFNFKSNTLDTVTFAGGDFKVYTLVEWFEEKKL